MQDLTTFTQALIEAHRSGQSFVPAAPTPATVEEVHGVHAALMETFGPVGGFKVVPLAGGEVVAVPIPAERCVASGSQVDARLALSVELEVGFIVVAPLPEIGAPGFRDQLLAAVRPAPMIELVTRRVDGAPADDPMVRLADLQFSEALVHGPPLEGWSGVDFGSVDVSLEGADGMLFSGEGRVPGGSAIMALEKSIHALQSRYGGLQVGQKLLTGTVFPLIPVSAGQSFQGHIDGLGDVSVTV